MKMETALGICDWGIGGLGFYNLVRAARPDLDTVYIGDQGSAPYGELSATELAARLRDVLNTFRSLGVARVVVACNAASSVLPRVCVPGVRATGVIAPALSAIPTRPPGAVGVIGGARTVHSQAYAHPLRQRGFVVKQRVAQPLSGLIERGRADAPETRETLARIVRPLHDVDLLVLACTHYVVLQAVIRDLLPGADLLDPAQEAWRLMQTELPPRKPGVGASRFYTTGDPDAMQRAARVFGVTPVMQPITLVPASFHPVRPFQKAQPFHENSGA